jgi:DNA topoisomerase-1
MSKILVIVESPGKIKKINEYLGDNYIVKASFGHVMDLDKKTISIDIENNFKPNYIVSPDKSKVVNELKKLTKECSDVILASDEDREGEAIAGSLRDVLKLRDPKRIVFHEITKKAISEAILNPRKLDQNLIDAQQARRLLDRLMGYKISPILWAYKVGSEISNTGIGNTDNKLSAGRVQSVVVRILVDKEKEIKDAISVPFVKTIGEFSINETVFKGTLDYHFVGLEKSKEFLDLLDKKCVFKVISVEDKKSVRKPSPPFITSTLQQDASTKLGFPVKKTMDIAQKLYEAGHITYMRTDSTNLSEDIVSGVNKYITTNYGKEYADSKVYSSGKGAQEAHEAVRPTNILTLPDNMNMDTDCIKLYSLIWKRTIACQMANARINIQHICIDILDNDKKNSKSLLLFSENDKMKQHYFHSNLETVEFEGYMKVYAQEPSEDSETNDSGKINIKVSDIVLMKKLKVSEEFTKLPLRFNEAGLIKFLEKNGIGRPSTYASIISKIIEKKYVEIKNIEGIKKVQTSLELSHTFKLKEITKDIMIGKESKKLVPTELGNSIVSFLLTNYDPIMNIKFTADFEEYLDKIAEGNAKWFNVLNQFYQLFNPICEKLLSSVKSNPTIVNTDISIGIDTDNNLEIFKGSGKYGPYVKRLENIDSTKWKYAACKNHSNITLEEAIALLKFPLLLGKISKTNIYLNKGMYGYYVKYEDKNIPIPVKDMKESDITIEYVKNVIENPVAKQNVGSASESKTFTVKNKTIHVRTGQFGPYIQIISGKTKTNIPIAKDTDINEIKLDEVLEIIANKKGTKPGYKKY